MDYQRSFFDYLKNKIKKDVTLTDYIEEKLHISRDGAYRRIGGRTALTWNEAVTLLQMQNLGVDDFLGTLPGKVVFDQISQGVQGSHSVFSSYVDYLKKISPHKMTYLTNSIPRNHLFAFPDLTFFQMFFMAKTMFGDQELQNVNFSTELPQKSDFIDLIEPFAEGLRKIPSIEILWIDAIDCLLKPILYYWETHQFENRETALVLLDKLTDFIEHLESLAITSRKHKVGESSNNGTPEVQLYFTEVPIQETTIIFTVDAGLVVLHVMNGLSIIATTNVEYCQRVQNLSKSIIDKATSLTSGGEKIRIQFFNTQRRKIETIRKQILLTRSRV